MATHSSIHNNQSSEITKMAASRSSSYNFYTWLF